MSPLISVILPVYNGEKYLKESIESILNQSFTNFELIIINDGSTDSSQRIIENYKDPRIIIINQHNRGLIKSLNLGISLAKGEWIARMDADDISYLDRFEEQLKKINDDTVVIGSQAIIINNTGQKVGLTKLEQKNDKIYKKLLIHQSTIIHPSVLINKSKLIKAGGYDPKMLFAEDFDLWLRLSCLGKLINVNKPLLALRKHEENISKINLSTTIENCFISLANHYKYLSYNRIPDDTYIKLKKDFSFLVNNYAQKMIKFESIKSKIKNYTYIHKIKTTLQNPLLLYYFIDLKIQKYNTLTRVKNFEF